MDSVPLRVDLKLGFDSIKHRTITDQPLDLLDGTVGGLHEDGVFGQQTRVVFPKAFSISSVLLTGGDVVGQSSLKFSNPFLVGRIDVLAASVHGTAIPQHRHQSEYETNQNDAEEQPDHEERIGSVRGAVDRK